MSKTDKTHPYWVRCLDRLDYLEEHHDHTDGVCDLPPRPKRAYRDLDPYRGSRDSSCRWVASRLFWSVPLSRCCCPLCSKSPEAKRANRKDRHQAKQKNWRDEWI